MLDFNVTGLPYLYFNNTDATLSNRNDAFSTLNVNGSQRDVFQVSPIVDVAGVVEISDQARGRFNDSTVVTSELSSYEDYRLRY